MRRCDYCVFATWTDRHHLTDAYVRACRREVEVAVEARAAMAPVMLGLLWRRHPVPALSPPSSPGSLMPSPRPGAEVTIECNPETVDLTPPRRLSRRRGDQAVVRRAVDGAPRADGTRPAA